MPKAIKQKGYPQTVIDEILKPDNRELVTAVSVFAAAVTVLHLGWAEFLLVI